MAPRDLLGVDVGGRVRGAVGALRELGAWVPLDEMKRDWGELEPDQVEVPRFGRLDPLKP